MLESKTRETMALIRSLVCCLHQFRFLPIIMSIIAIAKSLILYYPLSPMDHKLANKVAL